MEDLRSLLGSERCWIELGLALTPSAPSTLPGAATAARMVQVQLVPSGRTTEARVANLGQGAGRGIFAPILAGDEVLVLFPGGDPNRAVVLGGLGNATAPNPTGNLGLALLLQHPGGVQLVTSDGQPQHGIVHGQLLADLATYLIALEGFMFAISTATTAADIAAKAVTWLATVGKAGAAPSTFLAALQTAAAAGTPPGIGGPPYATALHKVTP